MPLPASQACVAEALFTCYFLYCHQLTLTQTKKTASCKRIVVVRLNLTLKKISHNLNEKSN